MRGVETKSGYLHHQTPTWCAHWVTNSNQARCEDSIALLFGDVCPRCYCSPTFRRNVVPSSSRIPSKRREVVTERHCLHATRPQSLTPYHVLNIHYFKFRALRLHKRTAGLKGSSTLSLLLIGVRKMCVCAYVVLVPYTYCLIYMQL